MTLSTDTKSATINVIAMTKLSIENMKWRGTYMSLPRMMVTWSSRSHDCDNCIAKLGSGRWNRAMTVTPGLCNNRVGS